jgi:CRP-like cAMP-binding protein
LPFQVLTINQGALHRLLESQPKIGHKILRAMARLTSLRLRQADDILAGFPGTSRDLTVA